MNESTGNPQVKPKRRYDAGLRAEMAAETRRRILFFAQGMMGREGIDGVTIAEIGQAAGVAASTIYAQFRSKEGILRALMQESLFGAPFKAAQALVLGVDDPVQQVRLTARVARAIYDSERQDLGMIRHASGYSKALRAVEVEFESLRFEMQRARVGALFAAGRGKPGLSLPEARRVLWALTGRAVYQALVQDGGWTAERYESWLEAALISQLVGP
jgi:AcrR family transcriptional regulator